MLKNETSFTLTSQKKRNNKRMRLQADQEFQQNEIKKLNGKFSVDMFSTKIHGRTKNSQT